MRDSPQAKTVKWGHAKERRSDFERVARAWAPIEAVARGASATNAVARRVVGRGGRRGQARRSIPDGTEFGSGLWESEEKSRRGAQQENKHRQSQQSNRCHCPESEFT